MNASFIKTFHYPTFALLVDNNNWGEPEQTSLMLVEHGTYVIHMKISRRNQKVSLLVVGELVHRTSRTQTVYCIASCNPLTCKKILLHCC